MRALARVVRVIDRLNQLVGQGVAWLTLTMVLVAFAVVILRYVFNIGFVWLQETYVWMHGMVFMLGAGYTLLHGGHVRVDVVYGGASPRFRAWVDLGGVVFLLLPLVIIVGHVSWPYVLASWQRLEASREAGGLPGLFLLKSVLLAFCGLVGLQGVALAGRAVLVLAGREELAPRPAPPAGTAE